MTALCPLHGFLLVRVKCEPFFSSLMSVLHVKLGHSWPLCPSHFLERKEVAYLGAFGNTTGYAQSWFPFLPPGSELPARNTSSPEL